MTKKKGKAGKMPVPFKAPARNIKGVGKLGTFEGGLVPEVIDPKYGNNPYPAKAIIKGNVRGGRIK